MAFATRAFKGGAAVGIDIDPAKVERTRAAGHNAVLADATNPDQFEGNVRFSIMSHFLEHLPDLETVSRAVSTAIRISDEFVFIRQPWFDSDPELLRMGLKFYWSDWHGHPMTLTSLQMYRTVRRHLDSGRIARVSIYGNTPVLSTDHEAVLPLSAPLNSGKYDQALHGKKKKAKFKIPAYKELVVVIAKRDPEITETLLGRFPTIERIFDARHSNAMAAGPPADASAVA